MVVIYCCLETENFKVLTFHVNNYSYFEISTSLFYVPPSDKCRTLKPNIY